MVLSVSWGVGEFCFVCIWLDVSVVYRFEGRGVSMVIGMCFCIYLFGLWWRLLYYLLIGCQCMVCEQDVDGLSFFVEVGDVGWFRLVVCVKGFFMDMEVDCMWYLIYYGNFWQCVVLILCVGLFFF